MDEGELGRDRRIPRVLVLLDSGGRDPTGGLKIGKVGEGSLELILEVAYPQQASNAAQELDLIHGLGEEIIGSCLNPTLEVGCLVESSDHQDQQVPGRRIGSNLAADFKAREPRHHDVEKKEVGLEILDYAECLFAIMRRADFAIEVV
jgi:hypothetical protein